MISVFELFKIGIGPSSSHTVGPMAAANRFLDELSESGADPGHITAELFGSLAWTGRGHGTDTAICLGLLGERSTSIDPDQVPILIKDLHNTRQVSVRNGVLASFDPARDIIFNMSEILPLHSNGMRFRAFGGAQDIVLDRIFYSIGGGFVIRDGERPESNASSVPYPFGTAARLLEICTIEGLSIAEVQLANECALKPEDEVRQGLDVIREAMFACIDRGMSIEGELPGGLKVKRRAKALFDRLQNGRRQNLRSPH